MNGNGSRYEADTLEYLAGELEDFESDETDESDLEAAGRRVNRRPPRVAQGKGLFRPRPSTGATGNYVTQVQLQTALARVSSEIKTNSEAIKTVSTRVTAVSTEQTRQTAALKKEAADRRKESDQAKKDVRQIRDMSAILPLLSRPKTITLATAVDNLPAGTKVAVDSGDSLSLLLPFMLFGGMGGGGTGSGSEGGSDNSMMMMAMVLALGK